MLSKLLDQQCTTLDCGATDTDSLNIKFNSSKHVMKQ